MLNLRTFILLYSQCYFHSSLFQNKKWQCYWYKVILIKYNTVETVTNPVERGKMDISNTQIHDVSIQFICIKHIHFMSI